MKKLIFTSKEDGLKLLKKTYLHESDVCEGEFADWLVDNLEECFDKVNSNYFKLALNLKLNKLTFFKKSNCIHAFWNY